MIILPEVLSEASPEIISERFSRTFLEVSWIFQEDLLDIPSVVFFSFGSQFFTIVLDKIYGLKKNLGEIIGCIAIINSMQKISNEQWWNLGKISEDTL